MHDCVCAILVWLSEVRLSVTVRVRVGARVKARDREWMFHLVTNNFVLPSWPEAWRRPLVPRCHLFTLHLAGTFSKVHTFR